jgi:hypothetical protein
VALSAAESRRRFEELGGTFAAGLIQLYVFTPVQDDPAAQAALAPGQFAAADTGTFVAPTQGSVAFTRGLGRLPRGSKYGKKFASLAELQLAIARRSHLFPPGTRPLAGWGMERDETLAETSLGPTLLTDAMVVRYAQPAQ